MHSVPRLLGRLKVGLLVLCIALSACAALGLTPAQTPEERLIYGLSNATAAEQLATSMLQARQLGSAGAECIQASARLVKGNVVTYLGAKASGKPVDATAVLTLVNADLLTLSAFVTSHGGTISCRQH